MLIDKPGFYRDKAGRKWEVVSIRGDTAIGWLVHSSSSTSEPLHASWYADSGTCRKKPIFLGGCDIAGTWSEPEPEPTPLSEVVSVPFVLYLHRTAGGDPLVSLGFARHNAPKNVIARKLIVITEGEGLSDS